MLSWIYLQAQVTLFAAEVNTVRVMTLWPRGLVADRPTEADSRVLKGLAETEERKPATEDYVPVLPWLGVMWWGMATGQWMLAHRRAWLTGVLPRLAHPLAVLGRWSLSFYMLHQPVLIGILMAVAWLRTP